MAGDEWSVIGMGRKSTSVVSTCTRQLETVLGGAEGRKRKVKDEKMDVKNEDILLRLRKQHDYLNVFGCQSVFMLVVKK